MVGVVDLTLRIANRIRQGNVMARRQRAHDRAQAVRVDFLLKIGEVLCGGRRSDEWIVPGRSQQADLLIARRLHSGQSFIKTPIRPWPIETADRPARVLSGYDQSHRSGLNKLSSIHADLAYTEMNEG